MSLTSIAYYLNVPHTRTVFFFVCMTCQVVSSKLVCLVTVLMTGSLESPFHSHRLTVDILTSHVWITGTRTTSNMRYMYNTKLCPLRYPFSTLSSIVLDYRVGPRQSTVNKSLCSFVFTQDAGRDRRQDDLRSPPAGTKNQRLNGKTRKQALKARPLLSSAARVRALHADPRTARDSVLYERVPAARRYKYRRYVHKTVGFQMFL
jgi:hypothetical protein